jgi:ribosomal-protein-alanine N-acetyltransferase
MVVVVAGTINAPDHLSTERLFLRRPLRSDAELIYTRYASDPEVTKFVGWPRHTSIEHTQSFLDFSEKEWERWPAGPYLIENGEDRRLLGSTGMNFEAPDRAMTGYVLAKEAWGFGYATEALSAIASLGDALEIGELFALCHREHRASHRVLEKCGFVCQPKHIEAANFPNLGASLSGSCTYALRYIRRSRTLAI